jgi:hypothetical protein
MNRYFGSERSCGLQRRTTRLGLALMAGWLTLSGYPATVSAAVDEVQTAKQVDKLLAKEFFGGAAPAAAAVAPVANDEIFIRRVTLDLIGEQPTPAQVTAFVLDPSAQKRAALVKRLLADKHYGQNWGRYWRDVIMYRRSNDRAMLLVNTLVNYLTTQFNNNTPWDEVARQFITATGPAYEDGSTALIMAHLANPEDVTAEVSRIFLGIQIQCAQCHDHKSDRWKRDQFHELAAFFPRVAVRRVPGDEKQSFMVVGDDKGLGKRAPGVMENSTTEHYMSDLNDPHAKGTLMTPVFFATGQKLELGTPDAERRATLARWLTSPQDTYFAEAFVNRLWSELVGRGFMEPVDDMGPDHKTTAPETLKYLAQQFTASHYDVKWLFRTIMATDAYQRQVRSRSELVEEPFAASCPQRLRADQVFNSLVNVLGMDEANMGQRGYGQGGNGPAAGAKGAKEAADSKANPNNKKKAQLAGAGPRGQSLLTFGYDPSARRDEIAGSIPQALWMMNSPLVEKGAKAYPGSTLATLLEREKDDEMVATELYLRCLAREPKESELKICQVYVRSMGSRSEAFEDILWSLVNSTEFLYRK